MTVESSRQDNPSEFEFGTFEIQDETNLQLCHFEVIQHLADFVVGNPLDDLCIDDYFFKGNEIRNIFGNLRSTIQNWKSGLLKKRNATEFKLHDQRIFVWLLMIPMPNSVQHGKRTADNGIGLFFE